MLGGHDTGPRENLGDLGGCQARQELLNVGIALVTLNDQRLQLDRLIAAGDFQHAAELFEVLFGGRDVDKARIDFAAGHVACHLRHARHLHELGF